MMGIILPIIMTAKADRKERTHEEILASAARLLRARGISGANVADVMKGAGLTVGGFYAHFASKEELVDESLERTLDELRTKLVAGLEGTTAPERLESAMKRYLSRSHRDDLDGGCPMPAVASEVGTAHPEHRGTVAYQIEALARELAPMGAGGLSGRQVALALFALMFGGLTLARAVRGTPLSDEILRACRRFGSRALRLLSSD
jgi:TetR/AcrR family transcriptional repressor of nem operon